MHKRILLVLLAVVLLAECVAPQAEPSATATTQPTPTPAPAPLTLTVQAVADPSLLAADIASPYSEINAYLANIYNPDETLYNALYRAVEALEPTFDASGFRSDLRAKIPNGFLPVRGERLRFYYFKNFKLSDDGGTFTDTTDAALNEETFCARLGQLLYNTAPENGTDLQKFMAVYEHICETANYSSDMSDYSTFSPYSIVMNGEGICNGYASLLKYTLDHLGIPAEFVSNEPHAWNIVQLDGQWYQTDPTWGAGAAGDTLNNTFTLLMDDATRIQSLTDRRLEHRRHPRRISRFGYGADARLRQHAFLRLPQRRLRLCVRHRKQPRILQRRYRAVVHEPGLCRQETAGGGFLRQSDGLLRRRAVLCRHGYRLPVPACPGRSAGAAGRFPHRRIFLRRGYLSQLRDKYAPAEKTIPLLPFDAAGYGTANTEVLPAAQFTRDRTFRFDIQFSAPVDASQDWNQLVCLSGTEGNPLRLHFSLSADGQTLTVRPAEYIADAGTVSLCIAEGVVSEEGATLASSCRMDVSLVSAVQP